MTKSTPLAAYVAGYARVSTEDQAQHGHSLEAQEDHVRRYMAFRKEFQGREIRIFREKGESGRTPLGQRTEGRKLMQWVDEGRISDIIAVRLDRLFRDTLDGLVTINGWSERKVGLHLVDQGGNSINNTTAFGRRMITMLLMDGQYESDLISERTRSGIVGLRLKDELAQLGGAGYGWRLCDASGNVCNGSCKGKEHVGHGKLVRRVEVPREQETIRSILDKHKSGMTMEQIAKLLNSNGVPAQQGGRWHTTTVSRLIARCSRP